MIKAMILGVLMATQAQAAVTVTGWYNCEYGIDPLQGLMGYYSCPLKETYNTDDCDLAFRVLSTNNCCPGYNGIVGQNGYPGWAIRYVKLDCVKSSDIGKIFITPADVEDLGVIKPNTVHAKGTHQCWGRNSIGYTCEVESRNEATDCHEALIRLSKRDDCCKKPPHGDQHAHSINFTLKACSSIF